MKHLALLLAAVFAFSTPAIAAKGEGKKDHGGKHAKIGKIVKAADSNHNQQIDSDEVAKLEKKLTGKALKKLDKNSNGKLDPKEIAKLNKKLAKKDEASKGKDAKPEKKDKKKKGKKDGKKKNR